MWEFRRWSIQSMRSGTWLSDRHYNCYFYYLETQEPKEDSHPCISAADKWSLPSLLWDIPKRISFHWFSHVDSAPRGKWIGRELITSWLPKQSSFKGLCLSRNRQPSGRPMPCLLPACARPPTTRIHMQGRSSASSSRGCILAPWKPGVWFWAWRQMRWLSVPCSQMGSLSCPVFSCLL